jgi:hypothetical protein
MTVRMPTEDEKRRAEMIQHGIWPGPPPGKQEKKVGSKGRDEASKRFGKDK